MRGHYKPPNAEGSDNSTETEQQTTREEAGCKAIQKEGGRKEGQGGSKGVAIGDLGRPSGRHNKNLGGGDSDSKNTT